MLAFSLISVLFLYGIERLQHFLLLSLGMANVPPALAFNTAASFVTNTNWQNYSGESTMGYLTQMGGLAVQNFLSAAVGLVIAIALIRGFIRSKTDKLGNFWVDVTRAVVRLLLPLSIVGAIILMAAGVVDNFTAAHTVTTLSGAHQSIVGGPVASQEVIKDMGNNGGGFFNANSAHPFESPNPFTNWFEIFLLLLIPFATPRAFGQDGQGQPAGLRAAGRHGASSGWPPSAASPSSRRRAPAWPRSSRTARWKARTSPSARPGSSLFAASTTVTSTGAVNSFHDSFTPFGGGIALFDIALGEIAPGGIGAGMYGILVLAIVTVFVGGLMVGRTPEYLGKKIRPTEMKYAALYFLVLPVTILTAAGLSIGLKTPQASILNPGPHGLTEIMYAFTSMANNNGSAFAGLTTATDLVQHRRRHRDADRPVRARDLRARPGRVAGPAAARARQRGDGPDAQAPVRRDARRRHPRPRGPDLLPGPGAGPVRRRTPLMSVTTTPQAPASSGRGPAAPAPRKIGGGLLDPKMLLRSTPDAFKKLDPRVQIKNPVMFVVEIGAVLTTYTAIAHSSIFNWTIVVWLWLTVVFANLAEAVAEGRGKAQAETLRKTKRETVARRLVDWQADRDRSA